MIILALHRTCPSPGRTIPDRLLRASCRSTSSAAFWRGPGILERAPLFSPTMPRSGSPYSSAVSNCGSHGCCRTVPAIATPGPSGDGRALAEIPATQSSTSGMRRRASPTPRKPA